MANTFASDYQPLKNKNPFESNVTLIIEKQEFIACRKRIKL